MRAKDGGRAAALGVKRVKKRRGNVKILVISSLLAFSCLDIILSAIRIKNLEVKKYQRVCMQDRKQVTQVKA